MSAAATIHHVGFVVGSIADTGDGLARALGAEWDREVIHDPLQHAKVTFMRCGGDGQPAVELVEPDGHDSPLQSFLAKGGGLHHVCYEVDSLDDQLRECRRAGAVVAKRPLPAAAFGGRSIAWVYTKQKLLVEYLER